MGQDSEPRFAAAIKALARPADVRREPLPAMHLVMALRLCALFELAGRDPLVELTQRFASVTAAEQVLALSRLIERSWPERYIAGRPCALCMTYDERTLTNLVRAAFNADREGFSAQIEGFVRASRHEPLYAQIVHCVAELTALQQRA